MNAGLSDTHPSIEYYDSDYPGRDTATHVANFDDTVAAQGLAFDVDRYRELAREHGSPILELCCGTGRVAIPLARDGHRVTAVDLSEAMLTRLHDKLAREPEDVAARIETIRQDITQLDLGAARYALVLLPFNSLLCLPDIGAQRAALMRASAHMTAGAMLVIDAVNPLVLPIAGDPVPAPFFTRISESTGREYTRFAALGPFDETQRQRLFGWYDELRDDGLVRRSSYSMHWRPLFRYELELLLELCGFRVTAVEGGHRKEPFMATSRKLFVLAQRI